MRQLYNINGPWHSIYAVDQLKAYLGTTYSHNPYLLPSSSVISFRCAIEIFQQLDRLDRRRCPLNKEQFQDISTPALDHKPQNKNPYGLSVSILISQHCSKH